MVVRRNLVTRPVFGWLLPGSSPAMIASLATLVSLFAYASTLECVRGWSMWCATPAPGNVGVWAEHYLVGVMVSLFLLGVRQYSTSGFISKFACVGRSETGQSRW